MKIKCIKCGSLKGISKDRYNKLVELNNVEGYICISCRRQKA